MQLDAFFVDRATSASDDDLLEDVARLVIGTEYAADLVSAGIVPDNQVLGFVGNSELRALGSAIFARVSEELYILVCGNKKLDKEDKAAILNSAGLSDAAILAAICKLLVDYAHFSVPLAVALAGLILRHILRPAGSEVCKFWKQRLNH